jgi:hypothetical protein
MGTQQRRYMRGRPAFRSQTCGNVYSVLHLTHFHRLLRQPSVWVLSLWICPHDEDFSLNEQMCGSSAYLVELELQDEIHTIGRFKCNISGYIHTSMSVHIHECCQTTTCDKLETTLCGFDSGSGANNCRDTRQGHHAAYVSTYIACRPQYYELCPPVGIKDLRGKNCPT